MQRSWLVVNQDGNVLVQSVSESVMSTDGAIILVLDMTTHMEAMVQNDTAIERVSPTVIIVKRTIDD